MIGIIDYGMGNLGSIANMLKKVGAHATVSADPKVIERVEKLILPGVGAFDNGMKNLAERELLPVLNARVLSDRIPILGLCLGMQLFSRRSEEGKLPGLGWIPADTVRFASSDMQARLRIPHMGWNTLRIRHAHKLFEDMDSDSRFYFVHSYHLVCSDESTVLAYTNYGYDFASVVGNENILGVQFHPEKSHKFGMKFLQRFAERL